MVRGPDTFGVSKQYFCSHTIEGGLTMYNRFVAIILFLLFTPLLLVAEVGSGTVHFTYGSGTPTDMTGATEVIGADIDNAVAGVYDIG